jgi:hypothetical protein
MVDSKTSEKNAAGENAYGSAYAHEDPDLRANANVAGANRTASGPTRPPPRFPPRGGRKARQRAAPMAQVPA